MHKIVRDLHIMIGNCERLPKFQQLVSYEKNMSLCILIYWITFYINKFYNEFDIV
jgi:hypothetical protein